MPGAAGLLRSGARHPDDFEPTPDSASVAFFADQAPRLRRIGGPIWEPAAGDGAILRVAAEAGFATIASDLVDRGCGAEIRDFYSFGVAPARILITNPPFQECTSGDWFRHAFRLDLAYMALLLPLAFFCSRRGLWLYEARRPDLRLEMAWRVGFRGEGNPANHQWAIWDFARRRADCAVRPIPRPKGVANIPPAGPHFIGRDARPPSLFDRESPR